MLFSQTQVLVNLAKSLAREPKALEQLSMNQTTASYKTTYGMAEPFKEHLINKLKESIWMKVEAIIINMSWPAWFHSMVCEHWDSIESGPQIRVHNRKLFFLFLNQNICCGYSKEPSR